MAFFLEFKQKQGGIGFRLERYRQRERQTLLYTEGQVHLRRAWKPSKGPFQTQTRPSTSRTEKLKHTVCFCFSGVGILLSFERVIGAPDRFPLNFRAEQRSHEFTWGMKLSPSFAEILSFCLNSKTYLSKIGHWERRHASTVTGLAF